MGVLCRFRLHELSSCKATAGDLDHHSLIPEEASGLGHGGGSEELIAVPILTGPENCRFFTHSDGVMWCDHGRNSKHCSQRWYVDVVILVVVVAVVTFSWSGSGNWRIDDASSGGSEWWWCWWWWLLVVNLDDSGEQS